LVEWHETEVDAADLIQRAVAEVESVAVSYGVSVAFTMEPALPTLHVDRERVAQALTILLAMAVRSASEGSEIVIQIAGAHGGWVFTVGGTSFVYPHAEAVFFVLKCMFALTFCQHHIYSLSYPDRTSPYFIHAQGFPGDQRQVALLSSSITYYCYRTATVNIAPQEMSVSWELTFLR